MDIISDTFTEELRTDIDLAFVGGAVIPHTLGKGDSYRLCRGWMEISLASGEAIRINLQHLAWYSVRQRTIRLPLVGPPTARRNPQSRTSATAPSTSAPLDAVPSRRWSESSPLHILGPEAPAAASAPPATPIAPHPMEPDR